MKGVQMQNETAIILTYVPNYAQIAYMQICSPFVLL